MGWMAHGERHVHTHIVTPTYTPYPPTHKVRQCQYMYTQPYVVSYIVLRTREPVLLPLGVEATPSDYFYRVDLLTGNDHIRQ